MGIRPKGAATYQPRAKRSGLPVDRQGQPRSAALGRVAVQDNSPERATQLSTLSMFRPFRAGVSDGYNNPGRRHARRTRVALPWADIWLPLRGDAASHIESVRVNKIQSGYTTSPASATARPAERRRWPNKPPQDRQGRSDVFAESTVADELWRSHFVLSGRILRLPCETGLEPDIIKRLRYLPNTVVKAYRSPQATSNQPTSCSTIA